VAHLGEVASGFGSLVAVCLNAGVTSTGTTVWETVAGVEPDVAVSWALRALDKDQFLALPVAGDPFAGMLDAELAELRGVSAG